VRSLIFLFALESAAAAAGNAPWDKSPVKDWAKAPAPESEPTFKPPVAKRLKLKNGMALLVVENRKLPIVAMTLVVPGAGSASDPAGKAGLASFTADLLDEGAGGLSALEISATADRLGASISASADIDAAFVSVQTLTKTLPQTIELLAKIVTAPAFQDKEVERVKGDRTTNLKLRRDRPREIAVLVLAAALYGMQSAYGHPTSGVLAEFEKLGAADAKAFYAANWNPAAMTLVVAGDVSAPELQAALDKALGAWKTAARKPGRPKVAAEKVASRLLLVDRPGAEQSDVRIGLVAMKRVDKRYFKFEVLRTALGDGFTSRLTQRLREQLGYTYGARASMGWRMELGPFVIGTALFTPKTAPGIKETMTILDDLATKDLPEDELRKAKQNLIRALPAMFETNADVSGVFAELSLHKLPDDWYQRYSAEIRKVTAKDVKAMAKSVIPSKNMVVVVVGDLAKVRAELEQLGLGAPKMFDPDGMPLK
jgi:zinc protease